MCVRLRPFMGVCVYVCDCVLFFYRCIQMFACMSVRVNYEYVCGSGQRVVCVLGVLVCIC